MKVCKTTILMMTTTIFTAIIITEFPVMTIATRQCFKTNPGAMEAKLCTVFKFENSDKNA